MTFSVAFGESPSVPVPDDPVLATLERAITEHPTDVTAIITRTRYRFAKLNRDREDIGDDPLAKDFGSDDRAFTDALKPILIQLDADIARLPESAVLLVERSRLRLIYQVCSSGRRRFTFDYADPVKDLMRATELEPANASAWYELGLAHLSLWQIYSTAMALPRETDRAVIKNAALMSAVHAFSRAILASPDHSGYAHLLRRWTQRALAKGADPEQVFVDADTIIQQDLTPTDAAWDAVLHPARPAAKRATYLAEAHFLRGQIRVDRGEFTAGLADFDQALVLEPTHPDAHFDRGRLFVQRGDYARALADLNVFVKARPYFVEGWFWRGMAHDGAGEIELARADFDQAIKYDKAIGERLAQSRYDPVAPNPARGLAPRPVTADTHPVPSGTALEHKNTGNALRGRGDVYGALREYSAALRIDPTFADGYNNRGTSYRALQEPDLALADLNRAIELDPKHRAAYLNRAPLWTALGDNARALADYDHAVDYADNASLRSQAYLERGRFNQMAKQPEAAKADYLRATEITPGDSAAWSALALFELNQSQFTLAIQYLRQSLSLDPKNATNRVYLAVTLAIQTNESAADELDIAFANFTAESDQLAEAKRIVERALKVYPSSVRLKELKDKIEKRIRMNSQTFV